MLDFITFRFEHTNAKRQTPNAKRQTINNKPQTPNTKQQTFFVFLPLNL